MKNTLVLAAALAVVRLLSSPAFADDPIVATTLLADGSTNTDAVIFSRDDHVRMSVCKKSLRDYYVFD